MVAIQIPTVVLNAVAKQAAMDAFGRRITAEKAVTRRALTASEHRMVIEAERLASRLAVAIEGRS